MKQAYDTTHAIALAVEPLRADAIKRAQDHAAAQAERMLGDLEAAGWDINKVAPPEHGRMAAWAAQNIAQPLASALCTSQFAGQSVVAVVATRLPLWPNATTASRASLTPLAGTLRAVMTPSFAR